MKINFSIKSAVFAAAAAMCGAVFFASPALAQTPAAALNFENERLELTGISSPGIWLIYSHASETSSEGNRVLFGSGTDGSDIKYVPFADLYTDSAFSFDTPFIAFRNLISGLNTTPRLRIAGISGGTATIEQSGQLLSVNIDDLTNVLSLTVTPAELSFQWQQRPSGAPVPFQDSSLPSAEMQVFNLPAGQEAQVLITDNAGLAEVQTVALAAAVTPPVTPPFTQPENPASSPEWTVTLNTTAARISLFAAVDTGGEGLGPYSFSSATPNTRSGGTYVDKPATGTYFSVANLLTVGFDFTEPFWRFESFDDPRDFSNRLRVAGISGGEATIEKDGQLLSVNIDDLTNVLAQTVTPAELAFQWQTKPPTPPPGSGGPTPTFNDVTQDGDGQTYNPTTLPNAGVGFAVQVLVTDNAGLAEVQTIAIAAAPPAAVVIPQGTVTINAPAEPFVSTSSFSGSLNITNGVSGGEIAYAFQFSPNGDAPWAADDNDSGDLTAMDFGDGTGVKLINILYEDGNIGDTHYKRYFRVQAVYTNTGTSVTATIFSPAFDTQHLGTGLTLAAADVATPPGATLTANISGVTDRNNDGFNITAPSYAWFLKINSGASFVALANASEATYIVKSADLTGLTPGQTPEFRVDVAYQDRLGYGQTLTAFATVNLQAPTIPQGTVTITAPDKPFVTDSDFSGSLNITNGVTGGNIVYAFQFSPNGDAPWAADDNGNADAAALATPSGIELIAILNEDGNVVATHNKRFFRVQAVYTDTSTSVTATFFSAAVDTQELGTGLTLAFADVDTPPGATLTANISGITDANNGNANVRVESYKWFLKINTAASFVALANASEATYIVKSADLTGLTAGQTPEFRVDVAYQDRLGYGQTLTAFATVNLQAAPADPNSPSAEGWRITLNTTASRISLLAAVDTDGQGVELYAYSAATDGTRDLVREISGNPENFSVADLLTADFNFTHPFYGFLSSNSADDFSQRIRVAGISGGEATADKNGQVNSVNISGLTNVLGQTVNPWELTYQWQSFFQGRWTNDPAAAARNQTYNSSLPARVLITDKAGLSMFAAIESSAPVAPVPHGITVGAVRQSEGGTARNVDAVIANPNGLTIASTVYQWLQGTETGPFSAVNNATDAMWFVPRGTALDVSRPFAIVSVILMVDGNAITLTSAPVRIAGSENNVIVTNPGSYTVGAVWGVNFSGNNDIFGSDLHESYYSYQWQAGAAFSETSQYNDIAGATSFSLTLAAANINAATPFVRVLGVDIAGLNTVTLTSSASSIDNPTNVNGSSGVLAIVISGAEVSGDANTFQDNNGLATLAYQWELARGGETSIIAAANTVAFANGAGQTAAEAAALLSDYTIVSADLSVDSAGSGAYSVILSVTHTDPFGFTTSFLTTMDYTPAAVVVVAPTRDLTLDETNKWIWIDSTSAPLWNVFKFAATTGGAGQSVGVAEYEDDINSSGAETYSVDNLLSDSFDFANPFFGFINAADDDDFSNRVRVAGITVGTATVDEDGLTLSVNIGDLTNVLSLAVTPAELSFEWQDTDGNAISGATSQTYTADAAATVQVQITDRAGLSMFAAITATATAEAPPTAPETPQGTVTLRANQDTPNKDLGYNGSLNITNGISGGVITYNFQLATATTTPVVWTTIDNGFRDQLGDIVRNFTGVSTPVLFANFILKDGSDANRAPHENRYFRVRAIYTDTSDAVTVTFYSAVIDTQRPATGLSLAFADVEITAPGAVLTADITNITDGNDLDTTFGRGSVRSYTWSRRANDGASFLPIAGAEDGLYTLQTSDFADLRSGENPAYRVVALYRDGIGYGQNITATAIVRVQPLPTTPQGTVTITAPAKPFVADSEFSGSLNITNGVTGGNIAYAFQFSPNGDAPWAADDNANADAAALATPSGIALVDILNEDGNVNATHYKRFFRVQAVYSNTNTSVTATFFSAAVDTQELGTGLTLAFADVDTPPGATLTADISGVTDANNGNANVRVESYKWFLKINTAASFVALANASEATYIVKSADLTGLTAGQTPEFRVDVAYRDRLGYGQTLTASAAVNLTTAPVLPHGITVGAVRQSDGVSTARNVDAVIANPNGLTIASTVYQWLQGTETGPFSAVNNATDAMWLVPSGADLDVTRPFAIVSVILMVDGNAITLTSAPVRIAGSTNDAIVTSPDSRYTVGAVWGVNFSGNNDIFGTDVHESYYSYQWQAGAAFAKTSEYTNIAGATSFSLTLAAANINAATRFVRVLAVDIAGLNTATLTSNASSIANPTNVNGSGGTLAIVISGNDVSGDANTFQDNNGLAMLAYQWELTRGDETRTAAAGTFTFTNGEGQTAATPATGLADYTILSTALDAVDSTGEGAYSVILSVTHTDPFGFTMSFQATMAYTPADTEASCNAAGQRFDSSATSCVACPTEMPNVVDNVCQPSAAICNADNKILSGGVCVACSGNTPERSGNTCVAGTQTFCNADGKVTSPGGACVACTGDTPTRAGNVCQPSAAICNRDDMVLQGGACVACADPMPNRVGNACQEAPPTEENCNMNSEVLSGTSCVSCATKEPTTPVYDSGVTGNCRATQQSDCTTGTETFANGSCRPTVESDCSATETFADGSCRPTVEGDCSATETFANGSCRPTVEGDCTATETFADGSCRATIAADCTPETETFATDRCRATIAADCTPETETFATDRCRATIAADCTPETETFATDRCRATIAADCSARQTFATDRCRATVEGDCTGNTPVLDATSNECRATQQSDCTGTDTPVLADNACRARIAGDCHAQDMILNTGGTCESCMGETPVRNGNACEKATNNVLISSQATPVNGARYTASVTVTNPADANATPTYQWQGINAAITTDLSGEMGSVFVLSSAWNTLYTALRVSADVGTLALTSAPVQIAQPTEGQLVIDFPSGEIGQAAAAMLTANIDGVSDANDVAGANDGRFISYTWWRKANRSASFVTIAGATAQTYAVTSADFANLVDGQMPVYRLVAVYEDGLGYRETLTATATVDLQRASGEVNITGATNPTVGATYTISVNLMNSSGGEITYRWQGINAAGNATNLSNATGSVFALSAWNTLYTALRVKATQGILVLTSAPVQIAHPPQFVSPLQILTTTLSLAVGVELTATASVSDRNGNAAIAAYIWKYERGGAIVQENTSPVFILNTEMRVSMADAGNLYVQIRTTDGLGYEWVGPTTEVKFARDANEKIQEYSKIALNVFNLLEAQAVFGALGSHLDAFNDDNFANNAAQNGDSILQINGRTVANGEDILPALAARAADSKHSGKEFALDNFSWQKFGAGATGDSGTPEWSAWLRGGFGNMEGIQQDDDDLRYDGESFGIYGGVDRKFGNNIRAGLAAGLSEVEINADFSETAPGETAELNDKIRRELQSILPYAEWQNDTMRVRVIGGIGVGELEINESGDRECNATMDVEWLFGGLSGELKVYESDYWTTSIVGDVSYGNSESDAGNCEGSIDALAATSGGGGEWLLGGRARGQAEVGGGMAFSQWFGMDARQLFGDVDDELAYDVSSGLSFGWAEIGLQFDVEGRVQWNETAHRRNSFGGGVIYKRGNYRSSFRTIMNNGNGVGNNTGIGGISARSANNGADIGSESNGLGGLGDGTLGLLHRLEFGYTNTRGNTEINSNLYMERPAGTKEQPATIGAEIRFGF